MALPTFDKKDQIPKGFEDEYEEREGKWHPIDRTQKALAALTAEREAREAAETVARKAAKELAEIQTRDAARASGMTDEEFRKRYSAIEQNIRAELEPKVKEGERLAAENRSLKLDNLVKQMFREAGAVKGRQDDFWKMHGDEFDLSADGKPLVKAEPGKDVAKHVAGICKSRPEWMQGTRAAGGGAGGTTQPTTSGSGPGGAPTFEELVKNPTAAIAHANEG